MHVTIIRPDGFVSIDGVGYSNLDLSSIAPSIHAVQFNGAFGWIEFVETEDFIKPDNQQITSIAQFEAAITAWASANAAAHKPPPPPTPEQIKSQIIDATQLRLDTFARERNYDGILSLCTYATSTNPKFKLEGDYGVTARDDTWAKLYEIMADVESGVRPMPTTYADIVDELPVLQWPEVESAL